MRTTKHDEEKRYRKVEVRTCPGPRSHALTCEVFRMFVLGGPYLQPFGVTSNNADLKGPDTTRLKQGHIPFQ